MSSPVGYGTLRVTDGLWPHIDRLKPNCMLFIDDAGAAKRYADAFPDSISIFRGFRKDESDFYKQPGQMIKYVDSVRGGVASNVWINVLCEPSLGGDYVANLKLLVKESVECLDWAYARGIKLALPHGALYGLNPEHYPYLVPLINKINERPDLAIMTSDEYFGGHSFSGVHDTRGGEPWHIDPAHWLDSNWFGLPKHYHCGRITDLFEWCVAHGIQPPRWIATETGADDLSDIGAWLKTLKVTGGYANIRGWKTLTDQWLEWYLSRSWSAQRSFVEMLAALWRQVYSKWKNVVGLCLFTWGYQQDRTWEQFDLSEAGEFQSLLEKVNWSTTVAIQPVPKPEGATSLFTGKLVPKSATVNVRVAPDTDAPLVAALPLNQPVTLFAGGEVNADGYPWSWVEWLDNGAVKGGWMARLWPSWVQQIVVPVIMTKHVNLAVPFVTQNGWGQNNLCFEACIAMLARNTVTPLQVAALIPDRQPGQDTTFAQGIVAADALGVTMTKVKPTVEQMLAELDAGHAFIADVIRNRIPGWEQIYAKDPTGSHLIVIDEYTRYTDGSIVFGANDPLGFADKPGDGMPIKSVDLMTGMNATGFASTALFVRPKEVNPADFTEAQWAAIDARIAAKISAAIDEMNTPGK